MSDFIPKHPAVKQSGLGPKAQRLQALREKAAAASAKATGQAHADSSVTKPKSQATRKTAFQRKAT